MAIIVLTCFRFVEICDFGLAKWLPQQWTHHNVSKFEGTFGYFAPEYLMDGIVDEKTDLFSFRVLRLCDEKNEDGGMKGFIRKMCEISVAPNISDLYQILCRLDLQGLKRDLMMIQLKIHSNYKPIIEERRKARDPLSQQNDFLDVLFQNNFTDVHSYRLVMGVKMENNAVPEQPEENLHSGHPVVTETTPYQSRDRSGAEEKSEKILAFLLEQAKYCQA